MRRYVVHMTFWVPGVSEPVTRRLGDGLDRLSMHRSGETGAVNGIVAGQSPVDAALRANRLVLADSPRATLLSWRADSMKIFAGRRDRGSGGAFPTGGDDGGGTAGVREPRRPLPGPGHLTAVLDEPTGPAAPQDQIRSTRSAIESTTCEGR